MIKGGNGDHAMSGEGNVHSVKEQYHHTMVEFGSIRQSGINHGGGDTSFNPKLSY